MASRALQILAGLALLAIAAWLMWPNQRPLPAVTFTLTDGSTLSSAELRGKNVLVNFWSISCEVCLRDMPRLTAMQESLGGPDFTVIGVAMPHDPPPAVIASIDRLQPGYPIALDVHGELSRAFGDVRVTPTTFLIDRSGSIRYTEHGALDEIRIRATLTTL